MRILGKLNKIITPKMRKRNGPNAKPRIIGIKKTSKRKIKSDPKFLFDFFLFMKVKKGKLLLNPLLERMLRNSRTKAGSTPSLF